MSEADELLRLQALKEGRRCVHVDEKLAHLALAQAHPLDAALVLHGEDLHAQANAEDRQAQREDAAIVLQVGVIGTGRTARDDDGLGLALHERVRVNAERKHFCVHAK